MKKLQQMENKIFDFEVLVLSKNVSIGCGRLVRRCPEILDLFNVKT